MSALEKGIDRAAPYPQEVAVRWQLRKRMAKSTPHGRKRLNALSKLIFFYDNYEPVGVEIETGLTSIRFFDLNTLEDDQVGYKWDGNSNKSQLNPRWPASFVVFMDDIGGGKPVIAVTDIEGTPVFASYDVAWPFKIADSLADFFFSLLPN
ncbi:hypothetical protein ACFS4T_34235 [Pseudomonas lini]